MAYSLHLIFRACLLTVFIGATFWSLYETNFIVTPMMLGLIAMLILAELIWKVHEQQRTWVSFLNGIAHNDFSRHYTLPKGKQQSKLTEAMDLILDSYEQVKKNEAAKEKLLHFVYENVPIGLFCLDANNDHVFHNKASSNLLNIHQPAGKLLADQWPQLFSIIQKGDAVRQTLVENNNKDYLVTLFPFKLQEDEFKLISIQDVNTMLSTHELKSWQKLIRVMTHEIMNSATPILSLIKIVNEKLLEGDRWKGAANYDPDKIAASLKAIEKRTAGLLNFVTNYKKINREIKPKKVEIRISDFLNDLYQTTATFGKLSITNKTPANQKICIDKDLMLQVFINLIKNGHEAVKNLDESGVDISVYNSQGDMFFDIMDKGPGIEPSLTDQIFLPFFTTKSDGSGIGLALAKKIIHSHNGDLNYQRLDNKTVFQIKLSL